MAPLPAVTNTLKVQFKFTFGQDLDVISSFHMGYSPSTITQADINAYAQFQATHASATWASVMPTSCTLTLVTVVDLNSATGLTGVSTTTVPGTGGVGNLPASTCVLCNGHVARRYRGGKPRVYLPWGTSGQLQDPQHWLPAAVTSFQAAINNLTTGLFSTAAPSIAPTQMSNVSYYQGSTAKIVGDDPKYQRGVTTPTKRPVPLVDQISAFTVNARPGTQRRRLEFTT